MKALLIVDMQEIYVGKERNKKIFRYEAEQLIDRINERIKEYDAKNVFYILNIFKNTWLNRLVPVIALEGTKGAKLVNSLEIVSQNFYYKNKGNAFTNKDLHTKLKELEVDEIEVVGVDGGGCAALTALGALELEYKVQLNTDCIGTVFKKKAIKLNEQLSKNGGRII